MGARLDLEDISASPGDALNVQTELTSTRGDVSVFEASFTNSLLCHWPQVFHPSQARRLPLM